MWAINAQYDEPLSGNADLWVCFVVMMILLCDCDIGRSLRR